MTREEAIEVIKQDIPCEYDTDLIEALEMAIKALEQESKLLDTLDFAVDASNGDTNYFVGFRNGLRYAKSLIDGEEPQFESCAEQEPQTGHWVIIDDCEMFFAKCSECGEIIDSRMISKYPYCHCGAKMVEPQESEE